MTDTVQIQTALAQGETFLGIELGSTRIKAVLTGPDYQPIASGGHGWENQLVNGIWTYALEDVWSGIQAAYAALAAEVLAKYGHKLTTVKAMGFSAMMHGYLVFDGAGNQLAPFRTWRNTMTAPAAAQLTELFQFNIPQRWSIAHLQQAILNSEAHVPQIRRLYTLAAYVHEKLTGQRVVGAGEASGMFPLDSAAVDYDEARVAQFDALNPGFSQKLRDILPAVLPAGASAGTLTAGGAALIDPTGALQDGIPLCPPEGDAGTGMICTNTVAERTGNVSAGTSIFATLVMEKPLSKLYTELDLLTTPSGKPVAMVHCNNCTTDFDAWVKLLHETAQAAGANISKPAFYDLLYAKALEGAPDGGGLLAYNYVSGEHLVELEEGRPLFVRLPDGRFDLANFMRTHLYAAMASLKLGMDILTQQEGAALERLLGHGGLFKTPLVGQKLMAGALNVPVAVMETAGEGGAWGIALLAAFMAEGGELSLEAFLADKIFADSACITAEPGAEDVAGFAVFIERYRAGLAIERAAVAALK